MAFDPSQPYQWYTNDVGNIYYAQGGAYYDQNFIVVPVLPTTWPPSTGGGSVSGDITASGFTMATAKLLGRSTAGTGSIEAISIGSNLTLSSGVLSSTGGGTPGGSSGQLQGNISGAFAAVPNWTFDTTGGFQTFSYATTANTSTDGAVLASSSAASASNQQFSPRIRWRGFGWKTTATAASQSVDFIAEVQPVQGTTAPTGSLVFSSSVNGGAYGGSVSFDTSGNISIPSHKQIGDGQSLMILGPFNSEFSFCSSSGTTATNYYFANPNLRVRSDCVFAWASTARADQTLDTGMSRTAAATIAVGNGTASNTAGDLLLRGVRRATTFTVSTLPAASTAGDGMTYRVTDLSAPTLGAAPAGGGTVHGDVTSNATSYTVTQFG
jgi:hypothetical protein